MACMHGPRRSVQSCTCRDSCTHTVRHAAPCIVWWIAPRRAAPCHAMMRLGQGWRQAGCCMCWPLAARCMRCRACAARHGAAATHACQSKVEAAEAAMAARLHSRAAPTRSNAGKLRPGSCIIHCRMPHNSLPHNSLATVGWPPSHLMRCAACCEASDPTSCLPHQVHVIHM